MRRRYSLVWLPHKRPWPRMALRVASLCTLALGMALFAVPDKSEGHSDRYDQLRPQHTSGMCIDVSGGSTANGALVPVELSWREQPRRYGNGCGRRISRNPLPAQR